MAAPTVTHHVRVEIQDRLVAVGDLHNHPRNPRRGDVEGVATSLERFGQMRPIIAMRDGTIVAGNHTYRAALLLGWTHVAADLMDLDQGTADAYLIADNRWSDVAEYDYAELLDLVEGLQERDLLAGVGYDAKSMSELAALVEQMPPPGETDPVDPENPEEPDAEEEDDVERGSKLAVLDVAIEEPQTQVEQGALVRLGGRHYLMVESVFTGHDQWGPVLAEHPDAVFAPYPIPTLPLTKKAAKVLLVMVQPDTYLAGHLIDKWISVEGADSVEWVRRHR